MLKLNVSMDGTHSSKGHTSWNPSYIGSLTAFDCEALPLSLGSACAAMPMSILDYVSLDSQSPSLQPSHAPNFLQSLLNLLNEPSSVLD